MGGDSFDQLAARIRRLPVEGVQRVEQLVAKLEATLECGGPPPLSSRPESTSHGVKDWPHAPLHRLSSHGTYIVTAGTLHKEHRFRGGDRLDLLERSLLATMRQSGWQLEAWAVFSNHYHFVAQAEPGATDLRTTLNALHAGTAREVNRLDSAPGRVVWHNFWDTELTYEKSYLARLNYVHQNPVKHGLAPVANQYPWCSAAWFERTATPAQVRTIYSFKTDRVKVADDYEPV